MSRDFLESKSGVLIFQALVTAGKGERGRPLRRKNLFFERIL